MKVLRGKYQQMTVGRGAYPMVNDVLEFTGTEVSGLLGHRALQGYIIRRNERYLPFEMSITRFKRLLRQGLLIIMI